jgi:hypothetical protein
MEGTITCDEQAQDFVITVRIPRTLLITADLRRKESTELAEFLQTKLAQINDELVTWVMRTYEPKRAME